MLIEHWRIPKFNHILYLPLRANIGFGPKAPADPLLLLLPPPSPPCSA